VKSDIIEIVAIVFSTVALIFSLMTYSQARSDNCVPGQMRLISQAENPDDWYWVECRGRLITRWEWDEESK